MIGKMDQVVEIFTTSFSPDGIGGSDRSIVSAGQYWAEVKHLSGDEREHALRDADKTSVSFKMHNFEGFPVDTTSYINWSGIRYDVVDKDFDGAQRLFVIFKTVAGEQIEST